MTAGVANEIVYPGPDGKPMAENTKQHRWIVLLVSNLEALFRHAADVFVGGDLLWLPVLGEPGVAHAPDVFVVFGRPRGDRTSYKQWEEAGVPMTVVFEIWSPSNDADERMDKRDFYDDHGVEEYYAYDPQKNTLMIFLRGSETLRRIYKVEGFVSPRLGIRFDMSGPEMAVIGPDGRRFQTLAQAADERETLTALTRKVLAGQATPEEALELQRLLGGPTP